MLCSLSEDRHCFPERHGCTTVFKIRGTDFESETQASGSSTVGKAFIRSAVGPTEGALMSRRHNHRALRTIDRQIAR